MQKRLDADKAIRNLMKWIAESGEWSEEQDAIFDAQLAPVCEHFDIDPDELGAELTEHEYAGMMFGVLFEDFVSRRSDDGDNVIDAYLEKRGWRESVHGRQYLQQLRDSVLSLYEVVDVAPGRHCDVRDLVRGGKVQRVYERSGTETLVKWDRLAARVLKGDGKRIFAGGLLGFPLDAATELLELLEESRNAIKKGLTQFGGGEALTPEMIQHEWLKMSCPVFVQTWLLYTLERLRAPLPELVNRDGDTLVFTETRFPLAERHREETIRRLDAAPEWERASDDEPTWNWIAEPDSVPRLPAKGLALDSFLDGSELVHGMVELLADELQLTANSLERTERAKQTVALLLHGLIGPPSTRTRTPEQALEEAASNPESDDPNESRGIDPVEAERVMHEFMEQHYRRCLDDPLPALDGQTPRQCASSASQREKVVAWLKQVENHEYHRASETLIEPYDVAWMWDELGLARYRR
ncbi:MAG: hypothetical protein ACREVE_03990 [Gammaproteobacteria bacterium]